MTIATADNKNTVSLRFGEGGSFADWREGLGNLVALVAGGDPWKIEGEVIVLELQPSKTQYFCYWAGNWGYIGGSPCECGETGFATGHEPEVEWVERPPIPFTGLEGLEPAIEAATRGEVPKKVRVTLTWHAF